MQIEVSPSQGSFLRSKAPVTAFLSGLGSGKTWVGTLWVMITALENQGSLGLIGASTPAQLHSVVMPSLKKHLQDMGVEHYLGERPPWKSRFESHSNVLSIAGGTQVLLRSMFESGIDRGVRGVELDFSYVDECREIEEMVLDVLLGRMRGKVGPRRIRMTSTPNGKRGWLYRRMILDKPASWHVLTGCTMDNLVNLPEGYVESLQSTYGSEQYSQEVLGNWVDLQQGIAHKFSREKNLQRKELDPSKPLLFSMDLNVAPLCGVLAQHDEATRTLHVHAELVIEDNAQTAMACQMIGDQYASRFPELWHLCDESGGARSTRTTSTDVSIMRQEMKRLFARTRSLNGASKPRVIDRYNSVNAMLDPAVGDVRLTIDPSCKELIADMEQVSWLEWGKIDKSDPRRTHAGDALGYLVHRLFPVGRPSASDVHGLDGSLEAERQVVPPHKRGFPRPVGAGG